MAPVNLLVGLPADLSAVLFAKARSFSLSAGETLFVAGDPGDGCYRIDTGLVKVAITSPRGRERILSVLSAGSVVGELSMIDDAPRSADVVAIRDSELSFISRAHFNAFADQHPEVYKHMMILLARRLRDTNIVVATTTFLSLKGRVAQALLNLAEAFGNEVEPGRVLIRQKVDQGDLAAMAGIARENVSRILNEWKHLAIISRIAGYYCLENKSSLEREARR